ncbi:hypothetical protein MKK68_11975 [Methylobacterium sp. E-016]|uniref:hypothetical protein n=1 Tax=Methylobacterium sp. E-016 TaxID=2836556 RepID=UPI001FB99841|nr:hypothetical protein [Methylobacterium sp. E-016]MCJ2076365.1 hypothetical protein [Methylobacterium sp. E-016]
MPSYFISTSDKARSHENEGLVLSGTDDFAQDIRQLLATMLHDEDRNKGRTVFTANAHDAYGDPIMNARVTMEARKL